MRRRSPMLRFLLGFLDAFVAVTAVGGGVTLAAGLDPMPAEWLAETPFESYLVPGILLAVLVGGSAVVAAVAVIVHPAVGGAASVAAGAIMIGWIAGEIAILNQPEAPTWVEGTYFGCGLVMAVLGLALYRAAKGAPRHAAAAERTP